MTDANTEKNDRLRAQKRKRIWIAFIITTLLLSTILSSMALWMNLDRVDGENGIDGDSTLSRTGPLYGTHACEEGGFSIQLGIDDDGNGELSGDEVDFVKNICHGREGQSGPMGNRGYAGYNGTDGVNGSNGTDGSNGTLGANALTNAQTGPYGPCPNAAVITSGTDSSGDGELAVSETSYELKMCFSNLTSGRLTDLIQGPSNGFTTTCSGAITQNDTFLFIGNDITGCTLWKNPENPTKLFENNPIPGLELGMVKHNGRVWFDADDGTGRQLWSSDGDSVQKESTLTSEIGAGSVLISTESELILSSQDGLTIFEESTSFISGTFASLTISNGSLIYNGVSGMLIDGNWFDATLHSKAYWVEGYHWFFANSNGSVQLHRSDGASLEEMTNDLVSPVDELGFHLVNGYLIFDTQRVDVTHHFASSYNPASDTRIDWVDSPDPGRFAVYHTDAQLWFDCNSASGNEPCSSDGTDIQITEITESVTSSNPQSFVELDGRVFALLDDGTGYVLAIIQDNTHSVLWDPTPGSYDAGHIGEMWIGADQIWFISDSQDYGQELYGWAHGEISNEWIIIQ